MKPSHPAVADTMRRMKKEMPALHYVEHRLKPHPGFTRAARQLNANAAPRNKQGHFKKGE